jgi:hypothetical protein
MKQTLIVLLIFISNLSFGQTSDIKKVKYARTEIEVPANYSAKKNEFDEYTIENNTFSATWLYLTKEMVDIGYAEQIFEHFEAQVKYSKVTDIHFISNGGQFKGKKYLLKGGHSFAKYKVLAFGSVDSQPLILNLGFKEDPNSDKNFDALMLKFISFKE